MLYVVIDTETSDLVDFHQPADAPGQGRMAELATVCLDDELHEQGHNRWYVRPDGWHMMPGASSVNGLTDEFLVDHGWPVVIPLVGYQRVLSEHCIIAGFNVSFDLKILRGELRRAGFDDQYADTQSVCLMRAMTPICRIPSRHGYKWPKLAEACEHYGINQAGAHGALGDALATAELMRRIGPDVLHEQIRRPEPC